VAVRPKYRSYSVALERDGALTADAEARFQPDARWTPEHLVLAALANCLVTSLNFHARRASLDAEAGAAASGVVGPRDDGTWGFVELECSLDVALDPVPPADAVTELLGRAERGCFVGASLVPKPTYRWLVNGKAAR
jgi:organic hydroperoxide reductase OsmC/OhrA